MTTVGELRARVEAAYAVLDLPSWPDPWPDRKPPDEAYSRETDPERYRIVGARARTWATVLQEALGVVVEDVDPAGSLRVVSPRPGALPLLLVSEDPTVVRVSLADPEWPLDLVPDCGCDACDSGSASFLATLDDIVAEVVQGPTVLLRGPGWHAHWGPETRSAGGSPSHPDFDHLMELCRRVGEGESVDLPRGARVAVSRSWLG